MFWRNLFILVFNMMVLFNAPAAAQDAKDAYNYAISYDVYAGGMHALKANYTTQKTADSYELNVSASTNGFIGKLFPWSATYESEGNIEKGTFTPHHYTSTSAWKKDEKIKKITFTDGDVNKVSVTEHGKTTSVHSKKIKSDLTSDALDLLTATVLSFEQLPNDLTTCKSETIAFDGKRKFKIILSDGKTETLNKSRYSAFYGPALKCKITVKPLAGFSKKDQKRGWMAIQNHTEEHGKPPSIWLSRLEENGPLIPVRMQIASSYGAVIAHLTGFQVPDLEHIETAAGQ